MLGLGRQTIVNVTKQLEEQQLVARSASAEDARLSVLVITPKGRCKLEAVEKISAAFDEQIRTIVGSEREADITQMLHRIVDAPFLAYED